MALTLNIVTDDPIELGLRIHDALCGWSSYINNDVILNSTSNEGLVTLVIGKDNKDNAEIEVRA